jgi:hypothetical protein
MTIAKARTCHRDGCIAVATVEVHGSGHPTRTATGKRAYCDAHWDEGYEQVRDYPTHGWTALEQTADTLF